MGALMPAMNALPVDLADVTPRYAVELDAFRDAVRAVARDIFCEHLQQPLESRPLAEMRETLPLFGNRLLDYLIDHGDVVVENDRARPTGLFEGRESSSAAIERYAAGSERRSSLAYFLAACRDIAGGVLKGDDGFRLVRLRDPRGVKERWEHVMLEAPILEPCRLFAARALAAHVRDSAVVLEGGAGVGVVLRTALKDDRIAPQLDRIAAYHFTDIDPALLFVGRSGLNKVASERLQKAMVYRRLDLDAVAESQAASGLEPGSIDCIVLEHVLYDVEDLHATLVSFRQLLKPTGALIFTGAFRGRPATFFPCEMMQLTLASYRRAVLDPPYRAHVGYLSYDEWQRSLTRAGFEVHAQPAPEHHERLPHGGVVAYPRAASP